MTTPMQTSNSKPLQNNRRNLPELQSVRANNETFDIRIRQATFTLIGAAVLIVLSATAESQSFVSSKSSSSLMGSTASMQVDSTYIRPTQRTKISNYIFDAYGPYPIVGAGIVAAINQENNTPPEWNQGAEGFGKRFGSDFAIGAVGTTTRYGLSEAFKQDSLYYRCECRGIFPRASHAVISTFTARSGEDGHRVFSVPSLIAPYAGSMTAVYGWYPNRYGAKDAFRIGNYSLLAYLGGNISLEFFHTGTHSLLARFHLNNGHGSLEEGPNK